MCHTLNRLIVQYSVTVKVNKQYLFITAATWFGETVTISYFLCDLFCDKY